MRAAVICIILIVLSGFTQAEIVLTEALDGEHDEYCADLLQRILNYRGQRFRLRHHKEIASQSRDIVNLEKKRVDVIWIATSEAFEQRIRPIRIPIFKGLLGHRLLVIQKSTQMLLDRVQSLSDFQKISLGQGLGWVDSDILRSNGFNVVDALNHDQLYSMLAQGRFEALPRGLHEPWEEIDRYQNNNLVVEKNKLVVYPLPMYFFVNNDNIRLAKLIYSNFDKMIDDGAFDKYFFEHPKIKNALGKSNLTERVFFHLDNPFLPQKTPLNEKKYWLDIGSLNSDLSVKTEIP